MCFPNLFLPELSSFRHSFYLRLLVENMDLKCKIEKMTEELNIIQAKETTKSDEKVFIDNLVTRHNNICSDDYHPGPTLTKEASTQTSPPEHDIQSGVFTESDEAIPTRANVLKPRGVFARRIDTNYERVPGPLVSNSLQSTCMRCCFGGGDLSETWTDWRHGVDEVMLIVTNLRGISEGCGDTTNDELKVTRLALAFMTDVGTAFVNKLDQVFQGLVDVQQQRDDVKGGGWIPLKVVEVMATLLHDSMTSELRKVLCDPFLRSQRSFLLFFQ